MQEAFRSAKNIGNSKASIKLTIYTSLTMIILKSLRATKVFNINKFVMVRLFLNSEKIM